MGWIQVLCLLGVIQGFINHCSGQTQTFNFNDYKFNITLTLSEDKKSIKVDVSSETSGWISIGFCKDPSMIDSDLIVGEMPNGNASDIIAVHNYYSRTKAKPILSSNSILVDAKGAWEDGIAKMSFSRPLDVDDKDKEEHTVIPLSGGQVFLLWAESNRELEMKLKHTKRGVKELRLGGSGGNGGRGGSNDVVGGKVSNTSKQGGATSILSNQSTIFLALSGIFLIFPYCKSILLLK